MQNILQQQDDLKNFSQQQLIMEMQRPSGNVPQFLVLSELTRRKRMQDDLARAEAANAPTVAEEVVMAAGMGDMSQMAQAMAPKTSMTENTGIAAMMPKQPTRMATGGVVKMQTAGEVPFYGLERKVFKGQEYFTDGDTVYKQYESGQLDVVRDPDIVEGVLGYSPSASTEVGSISSVLNADRPVSSISNTIDPTTGRSALDPVLGIRPEMIPQFPTEEDSEDPTNQSTFDRKNIPPNMLSGMPTRTETLLQDLINQNQTLVPGTNIPRQQTSLDNQPQEVSSLLPTYNEQIDPNAFTGRQSLDGSMVSTVGPTAAEVERAQKVLEMNPVTAPKKDLDLLESAFTAKSPVQYTETGDLPVEIDPNAFTGRQALDGQVVSTVGPTAAELENAQKVLEMNPVTASDAELEVLGEGLKRNTAKQNFLKRDPEEDYNLFPPDPRTTYNLGPGSTAASEPFLQNKNPLFIGGNPKTNMPFTQQFRVQGGLDPIPYSDDLLPPKLDEEKSTSKQPTFLDNQPQTREDMIEGETAAVINSAANTLANDVGEEALGAKGPEAAKAAQQGFDKRMWMRIAMFGLIASEGTAKSRSEAAKTFLAMDAKDKALETKERIATADRASRERTTNARVDATLKSIEQRRASAAEKNNITALQSIQEYLQDELLKVSNPLGGPKEGAINADAYNKINAKLKRVVDDIAKIGGTSLTAYDADNLYQDNVDLG
jgi:hypothetical protein